MPSLYSPFSSHHHMETERGHRNAKLTDKHHPFIQCAVLILPYLLPADLASTSSTCKAIRDISESVTLRRSSDAARTLESNPIPFFNPIDNQSYSYFIYTPTQTLSTLSSNSSDVQAQPWGYDPDTRPDIVNQRFPDPFLFRVEGARGCTCEGKCERALGCPCFDDKEMLCRECGPSCGCGAGCGNRVIQGGILVKLKIVKDKRKGWGLYAAEFIAKGRFVCEYAGKLLFLAFCSSPIVKF